MGEQGEQAFRPEWAQTDLTDDLVPSIERVLRDAGQDDRADEFVRRAAEIMSRPLSPDAGEWRRTIERTMPGRTQLLTIRAVATREYVRVVPDETS